MLIGIPKEIKADEYRVDPHIRTLSAHTGLSIKRMSAAKIALPDPTICAQAFRQTQERLVVMTRRAFEDAIVSTIAAAWRVPVLVIEPPSGTKPAH